MGLSKNLDLIKMKIRNRISDIYVDGTKTVDHTLAEVKWLRSLLEEIEKCTT